MQLVRFLMKLENEKVQVELKNGTIIAGQIISVSPSMNINLKSVKMTVPHRQPQMLEYINVRGNQVRLVILPDELNLDNTLKDAIGNPKKPLSNAPPALVTKARGGASSGRGGRGGRRGGRGRARAF
ncbi:unnamed protein product [Ambrosiozyma monospora]|uniref:Unnamed protein product n=1 Tax=Ambrosiozyma monospora TaxID=43982 RepID=A0ACB5SS13_AMBMO|nr:unnamed protein product [Ambrosiozyma monospora]